MVKSKKPYVRPILRVLGTRDEIEDSDADDPLRQAARDMAEETDKAGMKQGRTYSVKT